MTSLILESSPAEGLALAGGKAAQLARLAEHGFNVPPWFCLGADAMEAFLRANHLAPEPPASGDLDPFARELEDAFVAAEMPGDLRDLIASQLSAMGLANHPVAVRSSGLDEDSAEHSFAGQYSTYLHQVGIDAVVEAVKRCWASAWSARVVSYRAQRGLSSRGVRMGVIVQKMIDADTAGVAFSRNPARPLDRDHLVISAVIGLGEGLVSGELDADHLEVERAGLAISSSTIVSKVDALRAAPGGGTHKVAVPQERAKSPALSDFEVRAVAKLCLECESKAGVPQDIEWAYEGRELYLLQSRPITSLPPEVLFDACVVGREPTLWDNSNIIESYSGVTSPLTFSFASAAYKQVYLQFCEVMGVPREVVDAHDGVYRNMLGHLRGRIYYNLINWYRLLLVLPGTASNKGFMETMMGVKQGLRPELEDLFEFMKHPPKYSLSARIKLAATTLWRFARIDSIIGQFQSDFIEVYEEARKQPFDRMSLPALASYYQFLSDRVLRRWQAPIINDYLTMIFFGLLKKLCESWMHEDMATSSLHNDLLCGEGDLESTEPTKALMRIAQLVDNGPPERREEFLGTPAAEFWRQMREEGMHSDLHGGFARFLDKYGFRCVNELKLEEPDLHDDPSFVVEAVASYVRMKAYSIDAMEKRERAIRAAAESKVRGKLSGLRRAVFFRVLQQARKAVRNRENLRFARTKIFGVARHLFRAMGARLADLGQLDQGADVFYLTVEEVLGWVEGRPTTIALRTLAAARKTEFEVYRKTPAPPDRFLVYGAVGASMGWPQILADADLLRGVGQSKDPDKLTGIPCCPGVVEGTVRVVREMRDATGMAGEILVTERTDPGWVPLYPSCSGLLIERGSLLSHSAVVARELGLPAIVGISGGLMSKLETGMRVRVDGGAGEVRILR